MRERERERERERREEKVGGSKQVSRVREKTHIKLYTCRYMYL